MWQTKEQSFALRLLPMKNLAKMQDMNFFVESLKAVFLVAIACIIVLQYLSRYVGEEHLQSILGSADKFF